MSKSPIEFCLNYFGHGFETLILEKLREIYGSEPQDKDKSEREVDCAFIENLYTICEPDSIIIDYLKGHSIPRHYYEAFINSTPYPDSLKTMVWRGYHIENKKADIYEYCFYDVKVFSSAPPKVIPVVLFVIPEIKITSRYLYRSYRTPDNKLEEYGNKLENIKTIQSYRKYSFFVDIGDLHFEGLDLDVDIDQGTMKLSITSELLTDKQRRNLLR